MEIGETRSGSEIGLKKHVRYVWHPCNVCAVCRWVKAYEVKRGSQDRCLPCARGQWRVRYLIKARMEFPRATEAKTSSGRVMLRMPCPRCNKERWLPKNQVQKHPYDICKRCASRESRFKLAAYKGWHISSDGYNQVPLPPWDAMYCMVNRSNYVSEHRLVMARHLGRPLTQGEQVHHINGHKTDNDIANLELWTRAQPTGVRIEEAPHCPTCTCRCGR